MSNTANVPQNYKFLGMSSLDQKNSVKTFAELLDFSNSKAFNYYRGMIIFCHETGKYYCWTDDFSEKAPISNTNFLYPSGTIYDDINYSNIEFNFIKFEFEGERGLQGPEGPQGPQGIPGPRGANGGLNMTNDTNETIYYSAVPFTIKQLQDNNYILSLGVNVKRIFTESVSFPEYFKNKNIPTVFSITELIDYDFITSYNLINDNFVKFSDFSMNRQNGIGSFGLTSGENPFIDLPLTEKFYYVFSYTLKTETIYKAKTPIFLSLNYSEENSNISFSYTQFVQDVVNNLNSITDKIQIISLPNKGELNVNSNPLSVNQIIDVSVLNSTPLSFAPNRLNFSENNGDFLSSFSFKLIDISGNKSDLITVDISSTFIQSNAAPLAAIWWEEDGESSDKEGFYESIVINYNTNDLDGDVELTSLEKYNGTSWVTLFATLPNSYQLVPLTVGNNLLRIKMKFYKISF